MKRCVVDFHFISFSGFSTKTLYYSYDQSYSGVFYVGADWSVPYIYISDSMFPRLGSSVAQLSVVPVRWTHPQEVSHLDTHTAPGYIQKVGAVCVCSAKTVWQSWLMIMMIILCPTGFPLSASPHLSPILPPLHPSRALTGCVSACACRMRMCIVRSCSRLMYLPYVCSRLWWSPSPRRCYRPMYSSVLI